VAPRAEVEQRVPTDAFGRDAHGTEVGVLLHVIDGYIDELEIYSTANTDQYGLPTKESLRLARWSEPDGHGTRVLLPDPPHNGAADE